MQVPVSISSISHTLTSANAWYKVGILEAPGNCQLPQTTLCPCPPPHLARRTQGEPATVGAKCPVSQTLHQAASGLPEGPFPRQDPKGYKAQGVGPVGHGCSQCLPGPRQARPEVLVAVGWGPVEDQASPRCFRIIQP